MLQKLCSLSDVFYFFAKLVTIIVIARKNVKKCMFLTIFLVICVNCCLFYAQKDRKPTFCCCSVILLCKCQVLVQ